MMFFLTTFASLLLLSLVELLLDVEKISAGYLPCCTLHFLSKKKNFYQD